MLQLFRSLFVIILVMMGTISLSVQSFSMGVRLHYIEKNVNFQSLNSSVLFIAQKNVLDPNLNNPLVDKDGLLGSYPNLDLNRQTITEYGVLYHRALSETPAGIPKRPKV